ncbi:MAG TPA: ABC transporter permease subunit [Myxococcaceae bacterium]|nr:ABC transporter permease subunit [Myxococcaceae bacterium]
MAFHPRRALAIFWKDSLDLRKNKGLLLSMLALPAVLVVVPAMVVWAYARNPTDPALRTMAVFYEPSLPLNVSAARFLIDKTLADWFGMYLVMPVFVPMLISSQSVAGEKERRTIEPLLASPATSAEIFFGKSLASLVPAVAISWGAFLALCVIVDVVAWPHLHELLLPNGMWLFGVLVIAPLFAFFGNGIAVLVSARVAEARLAQQFSALFILPLIGLVGVQMAGWLKAGTLYYAAQGLVIAIVDVALVFASIRLFDRERLISRWA